MAQKEGWGLYFLSWRFWSGSYAIPLVWEYRRLQWQSKITHMRHLQEHRTYQALAGQTQSEQRYRQWLAYCQDQDQVCHSCRIQGLRSSSTKWRVCTDGNPSTMTHQLLTTEFSLFLEFQSQCLQNWRSVLLGSLCDTFSLRQYNPADGPIVVVMQNNRRICYRSQSHDYSNMTHTSVWKTCSNWYRQRKH